VGRRDGDHRAPPRLFHERELLVGLDRAQRVEEGTRVLRLRRRGGRDERRRRVSGGALDPDGLARQEFRCDRDRVLVLPPRLDVVHRRVARHVRLLERGGDQDRRPVGEEEERREPLAPPHREPRRVREVGGGRHEERVPAERFGRGAELAQSLAIDVRLQGGRKGRDFRWCREGRLSRNACRCGSGARGNDPAASRQLRHGAGGR
jgi:hypothetical protein